jgi:hypothetical protein
LIWDSQGSLASCGSIRETEVTNQAMLLEVDQEQLAVLRRALEARVRDLQQRLGSEPGDDGYRHEARIATQLLSQVEGLERHAGHRTWGAGDAES